MPRRRACPRPIVVREETRLRRAWPEPPKVAVIGARSRPAPSSANRFAPPLRRRSADRQSRTITETGRVEAKILHKNITHKSFEGVNSMIDHVTIPIVPRVSRFTRKRRAADQSSHDLTVQNLGRSAGSVESMHRGGLLSHPYVFEKCIHFFIDKPTNLTAPLNSASAEQPGDAGRKRGTEETLTSFHP